MNNVPLVSNFILLCNILPIPQILSISTLKYPVFSDSHFVLGGILLYHCLTEILGFVASLQTPVETLKIIQSGSLEKEER